MKNPLTLEERARLGLLFEHEAHESFGQIAMKADNAIELTKDELTFRRFHVDNSMKTIVYAGAEEDAVYIPKTSELLQGDMNTVALYNPRLVNVDYKSNSDLTTNPWMLSLAIFQMVGNADRFVDKKRGRISIKVDETGMLSERCENLVYLPENAKDQGYFVKFSVTDNGPGFHEGKSLAK